MNTDTKRRLLLKASLAVGALGMVVRDGLLTPRTLLAARNTAAFKATTVAAAVKEGMGSDAMASRS